MLCSDLGVDQGLDVREVLARRRDSCRASGEHAIASRRPADHETALRRLEQAGAVPASVEILIMEALSRAGTEQFKAILPLVKEL